MIKILIGFIIIVSVLFFIAGGYLLGVGNQKPTTSESQVNTQSQQNPVSSTSATSSSSTPTSNTTTGKQTLTKALYDKSYDELLPFFANSVEVLIEATECCGTFTGSSADTRTINYLTAAKGEWNFDQNSPAIVGIKGQNPAGYQNTIVGTADNKYVLKLTLDETNKIKTVILANQ